MKKLHKGFNKPKSKPILKKQQTQQRQESADDYINRLISSN